MKGKHLTWNDRLIIERMILNKYKPKEIATVIGCCLATIYNELKRATYRHKNSDWTYTDRYSPDASQAQYEENLKRKGKTAKVLLDKELQEAIRFFIVEKKYSPAATILELNKGLYNFNIEIKSVNTIYAAIRKGYIEGVTMDALPRRGKGCKGKKKVAVQKRASQGVSIEKRDEDVLARDNFGSWEMDCVKGKRSGKKTLLVLTERKTRYEVIEVMKACDISEVTKALNRIEKRIGAAFYSVFNDITVDNGCEFSDPEKIEKSLYRKGKRTHLYYCHPYCPHERGSNENNNLLIRRFLPKGTNFDMAVNRKLIKEIESWMNDYPRKLFNGLCSWEKFQEELIKLGIVPIRI